MKQPSKTVVLLLVVLGVVARSPDFAHAEETEVKEEEAQSEPALNEEEELTTTEDESSPANEFYSLPLLPLQCEIGMPDRAEDLEMPPERLEIHPSVILIRNFLSDETLNAIENNALRCYDDAMANDDEDADDIMEDRYFGEGGYNSASSTTSTTTTKERNNNKNCTTTNSTTGDNSDCNTDDDEEDEPIYKGHKVTYMNQCLDDELYDFFVDLVSDTFETISWLQRNGSTAIDLGCHTFPDDSSDIMKDEGWNSDEFWKESTRSLNWADLATLVLCRGLNSRIIEFLSYSSDSSIGWHDDSETDLTVGALISPSNEFDGGEVYFKDDHDNVVRIEYERGDVAMWSGWTSHYVAPINGGLRKVFVNEFWTLPFNNHRLRLDPDAFVGILDTDDDDDEDDNENDEIKEEEGVDGEEDTQTEQCGTPN